MSAYVLTKYLDTASVVSGMKMPVGINGSGLECSTTHLYLSDLYEYTQGSCLRSLPLLYKLIRI
jgi:hypothetical protein